MSSNWENLQDNVCYILKKSKNSPYFWMYFVILIILLSGFGIWLNFIDYFENSYKGGNLNLALTSFSIVILYTSGIDLLSKDDSKKNGYFIIGILELIIPIFNIIFLFICTGWILNILCWIFYGLSLFAWWLSNGDKDFFTEEILNIEKIESATSGINLSRPKK